MSEPQVSIILPAYNEAEVIGRVLDDPEGASAVGRTAREHAIEHYDLAAVLTHELGHVLGLDESEVPTATMYPEIGTGETEQRVLDADDRAGIEDIYSQEPPMDGCTISPSAPRGSSGFWMCAALLLALGWRRRASSQHG